MKIAKPKRLPRKLKKKVIKSWGRKTYYGIMKGYIFILPYVIKYTTPEIIGFEPTNPIMTRYANKTINNKYYLNIGSGEGYYEKIKS